MNKKFNDKIMVQSRQQNLIIVIIFLIFPIKRLDTFFRSLKYTCWVILKTSADFL